MPVIFVVALGRTRVSAQKFFSRQTNYRSILAFLASQRSAQTRRHASPCPIAPPLALRRRARGMFAAQIPIAEPAARTDGAYLPRFRALALFERRPPERVDSSSLPASENLHKTRNYRTATAMAGSPQRS